MTIPFRAAIVALCAACLAFSDLAAAQTDTAVRDTVVALPGLEVHATRLAVPPLLASTSIAILQRGDLERATEPALTLSESLRRVPGLRVEGRGHLALGERISIRGMGARAAFGVRGVQVLLDGSPLTLPDGQAVTEIVEPAILRGAEVVRGPTGHLWGNGSGGVVALRTAASSAEPPGVHVRATGGTFGTVHGVAEAILAPGRSRLHVYGSQLRTDGYREHSAGSITRGGLHALLPVGPTAVLRLGVAGANQDVEHPGSLTPYEAGQTVPGHDGADARYVTTDSGKRSRQVQAFARLVTAAGSGLLEADLFGGVRDLENPLPFAWIGVDRRTGGARLGWQTRRGAFLLRAGIDLGLQRDDRINADNDAGARGATVDVDQRETVSSTALATTVVWTASPFLSLSGGLRIDRVEARLDDRIVADGDQSGSRTFNAASPALSIRWSGAAWTTYVSWSTAFDTPTTTELVNSPDGSAAFNPDVGPQRTRGLETGFRAFGPDWFIDFALFDLHIRDMLTSFQDGDSGRTYFDNAERARYRGLEGLYEWVPTYGFRFSLTGSLGQFRFDSGPNDGNDIPGLARGRIEVEAESGVADVRLEVRWTTVGDRYGDDANETRIPGYAVLDARLFHRGLRTGTAVLRPFIEIGNILDERYSESIVVNARGGRYLEPSPTRHVTAGVSARFGAR